HPGLIDWGESAHPATRLADSGPRLERLRLGHPAAQALCAALGEVRGGRVEIVNAALPALSARLLARDGRAIWL
nr:VOC family protein [Roseobacter sp.]